MSGKRQQHSLISKYVFKMGSTKLFRLAKFALTNLNENTNYQTSISKYPVVLFYL